MKCPCSLGALLLLMALACSPREPEAFVPPPSLMGRLVHSAMGPLALLEEPGGRSAGTLPEGLLARVVARQSDEAGREWLRVEADSLAGWVPRDVVAPAQGQEGRIETH